MSEFLRCTSSGCDGRNLVMKVESTSWTSCAASSSWIAASSLMKWSGIESGSSDSCSAATFGALLPERMARFFEATVYSTLMSHRRSERVTSGSDSATSPAAAATARESSMMSLCAW